MAEIFISYSRKDIAFARLLHEALTQGEMETWIDWARIPVGEKWWDEICAAIEQSNIFLFIISSHSVGSEVCKQEVDQALSHNKRIIPVIVDDTPEAAIRQFVPDLTAINWVIFRKDDVFKLEARPDENLKPEEQVAALPKEPQFKQALEKLNAAIHIDWAWVKAHTRLETRAREWERRKREGSWLLRGKDLQEAEEWLTQVGTKKDPQPTGLQREYVLASRSAESRRQRTTLAASLTALGIIAVCLVIAIVLGTLALSAQQTAQTAANSRATAQANALVSLSNSESLRLAAGAKNILAQPDGNAETAALLSIRALRDAYTSAAEDTLAESLPRLYAIRTFSEPVSDGYAGDGYSVAFSPDGKYVLTGGGAKTVYLWDAATGAQVRTFSGHTDTVESVAFSPDGKYVLTGSADKTAKLWDAATGAEVRTFSGHEDQITSVAFSPDGKLVLTGSADKTAKLWDAATGQEVRTFNDEDTVSSVAFSPDGKYVLIGAAPARLWDAATGMFVRSFDPLGDLAAFSPDGKYVLTGSDDHTAKLWDAATGAEVLTFSVGDQVNSIAFSPDGKYVLTGGEDKTAKLWDAATGKEVRIFSGHTASVESVAFSPDGKLVLTGSFDNTAKLWDIGAETYTAVEASGSTSSNVTAAVLTFSNVTSGLHAVTFSPDGKYVLTANNEDVEGDVAKLWDAATGKEVRTFSGHEGEIMCAIFSPDGKLVLTGSMDDSAKLWNAATGSLVRKFSVGDYVDTAVFSPDEKYILTGTTTAKLWDAATGQEVRTFPVNQNSPLVDSAAFSPDGKYVLIAGMPAKLWDVATGVEVRSFGPVGDPVAYSPDGKYVLAGDEDGTAKLWDAATGAEVLTLSGHTGNIDVATFSRDGKFVLTGSQDSTAKLWDTATGAEIHTFYGHTAPVTSVAFSPDGKYVLTANYEDGAELWETDYHDTLRRACARLTRDLTDDERTQYGITDTTSTCP